jgi:aldehyde:ferredoxin oxidoreductase
MRLAKKYGAPELAMQVKGLELPAYDPRGVQGHALGFATSNRGGCHLRAYMIQVEIFGMPEKLDRFAVADKAKWVKMFQDLFAVVDSAQICKFAMNALGAPELTEFINAVTGWNWTADDTMKTGERIYNLERMFINREGFTGKDDTLPKRFLEIPNPIPVRLSKLLSDYYEVRGWTDGKPTSSKLKELGLA